MPESEKAASSAASQETLGGDSRESIAASARASQGFARGGCAPDGLSSVASAERSGAAAVDRPSAAAAGEQGIFEGFLESSLVRYRPRFLDEKTTLSESSVCYLAEPAVATRSDGGILSEFIYAVPRHRPTPPPPESRRGYSEALSSKAARTIQAAAEIAYRDNKPFRAMWVFSVRSDVLAEFLPADGYDGDRKPARTLSGEIRRFFNRFDAYCKTHGLPEVGYAWAAESESSGARAYHPHAHCLVTLAVRKTQFAALAEAVERLWGWGSVNMTILRVPRNAATYCLKGVGYSVKGTDGNQGRVWGRRFGLSRHLRHRETRTPEPGSISAAFAVVDIANRLRERKMDAVKTPYGSFTRRGFYPENGATWAQVGVAASLAWNRLQEVMVDAHASLDSSVP